MNNNTKENSKIILEPLHSPHSLENDFDLKQLEINSRDLSYERTKDINFNIDTELNEV